MTRPRVLVTNDDGIGSEGLRWLASSAMEAGWDVVVAAPRDDASGSSAALTALEESGRVPVDEVDVPGLPGVPAFAVSAVPGFIALIASRGAFGPPPDVVLAGINRGLNTGNAILHSGTVGAAMTARTQGAKAMAVSIGNGAPMHWETARIVIAPALRWLWSVDDAIVLNVNVPNVEPARLRGVRHAPLASFGTVQTTIGTVGRGFVTIAVADPPERWEDGTDAATVADGYASVTALAPLCASDVVPRLENLESGPAAEPVRRPEPTGRRDRAVRGGGLGTEPSATELAAAIFDVDGVLVDSPHERAWRDALSSLMEDEWSTIRDQTRWEPGAFTRAVYEREISGKPRMSGSRAALAWFGVPDDDKESRALQYAARKQALVSQLIAAGEFRPFPDGLRLVDDLLANGVALAAASSSTNARALLEAVHRESPGSGATLADAFAVDVSGRAFEHGKPHPEMFLTAARELGVAPGSTVVIEDAVAGVLAAKAGGMLAIGVARADDRKRLEAAGADIVVDTLDDVDRDWIRRRTGDA